MEILVKMCYQRSTVAVIAAILLVAALPVCEVRSADDQMQIWNGSALQPLFNTDGISCDHWEIWYYKPGELHVPGKQWGSSNGETAAEVLKRQMYDMDFDRRYSKFMGLPYPSDDFYHENFLAPICVTPTAMSAKPETMKQLQKLGELTRRINSLVDKARTSLEIIEGGKEDGGEIKDKTPLEEFLKQVEGLPKKLNKVRDAIMSNVYLPTAQIEGDLSALSQELVSSEARTSILPMPKPRSQVRRFNMACALVGSGSETKNCASDGKCDTIATTVSCNDSGEMIRHTCVTDGQTSKVSCTDEKVDQ
jgi:hypothetical protein